MQRLARRAVKKKERRRRSEKKKKRQRGTNLFPSLPTEKTDRERERRREEGGRVRDGFFARVDAARDVGQRHVAGVMRRDTLVDGRRRRSSSSSSSSSLSSSVEEERVGPPPRSVIRQVGIHIYRVVKSIGGVR